MDQSSWTKLHYAAWNDDEDAFRRGCDMNVVNEDGETPLHLAACHNALSVVMLLLRSKAEVNAKRSCDGRTPLHLAAAEVNAHVVVEELIRHGADAFETDCYGWTPLHVAAEVGAYHTVVQLLKQGANIDAKAQGGDTPRMLALRRGHHRIVKLSE